MLVTVVTSKPGEGVCDEGTVAAAGPQVFERGTGRSVVGFMITCDLSLRLELDLMVVAHEMFHALVRRHTVLHRASRAAVFCTLHVHAC